MPPGRGSLTLPHHYWDVTLELPDVSPPGNKIRFRRVGPAATKLRALRILLSEGFFPQDVLRPHSPGRFSVTISRVETYE